MEKQNVTMELMFWKKRNNVNFSKWDKMWIGSDTGAPFNFLLRNLRYWEMLLVVFKKTSQKAIVCGANYWWVSRGFMITLLGWVLHIIRVNWFVFKLTVTLKKRRHCLVLKMNFSGLLDSIQIPGRWWHLSFQDSSSINTLNITGKKSQNPKFRISLVIC